METKIIEGERSPLRFEVCPLHLSSCTQGTKRKFKPFSVLCFPIHVESFNFSAAEVTK